MGTYKKTCKYYAPYLGGKKTREKNERKKNKQAYSELEHQESLNCSEVEDDRNATG